MIKRHPSPSIERLESRTLLSAASPASAVAPTTALPSADAMLRAATGTTAGVTLRLTAGVPFSGTLGSFDVIAPATNLHATICWGDGSRSTGTLKPAGVVGIDVIKFNVLGGHTYAKAGTYPIHIIITRPALNPAGAPVLVATLSRTAVVVPKATGSASVVGGVLKIVGTAGADTILVSETPLASAQIASNVFVNINGKTWTFPSAGIKQITVDAGDGNDIVSLGGGAADAARINAVVHGEAGNDSLTGGAGTDALYGDDGNDFLTASPGRDQAYGGAGIDTAIIIGPGAPPPPNLPPPPSYTFGFIAGDVEHIVLPA